MNQPIKTSPSLQQLYPSLSSDDLRIAQENLDRYVHLILRICKRLESLKKLRHE